MMKFRSRAVWSLAAMLCLLAAGRRARRRADRDDREALPAVVTDAQGGVLPGATVHGHAHADRHQRTRR